MAQTRCKAAAGNDDGSRSPRITEYSSMFSPRDSLAPHCATFHVHARRRDTACAMRFFRSIHPSPCLSPPSLPLEHSLEKPSRLCGENTRSRLIALRGVRLVASGIPAMPTTLATEGNLRRSLSLSPTSRCSRAPETPGRLDDPIPRHRVRVQPRTRRADLSQRNR